MICHSNESHRCHSLVDQQQGGSKCNEPSWKYPLALCVFPSVHIDCCLPHRTWSCSTLHCESLWTNSIESLFIQRLCSTVAKYHWIFLLLISCTRSFHVLDLAREKGQDGTIIPFAEHHRLPPIDVFNLINSLSTPPVIQIGELQFERCFYANSRHEVSGDGERTWMISDRSDCRCGKGPIKTERCWRRSSNFERILTQRIFINRKSRRSSEFWRHVVELRWKHFLL